MTDAQALALLNDWPDGTPKSFGTDFTAHHDGQPSMFGLDRWNRPNESGLTVAQTSSMAREKAEATGSRMGRIKGMSARADRRMASSMPATALHVYGRG
jgi:hypothetical protein